MIIYVHATHLISPDDNKSLGAITNCVETFCDRYLFFLRIKDINTTATPRSYTLLVFLLLHLILVQFANHN